MFHAWTFDDGMKNKILKFDKLNIPKTKKAFKDI